MCNAITTPGISLQKQCLHVGLPATSQRLGLRTLISAALGRHQRLTLATLRLSRIGQGVDPFYVVCEGIWVAHADIN